MVVMKDRCAFFAPYISHQTDVLGSTNQNVFQVPGSVLIIPFPLYAPHVHCFSIDLNDLTRKRMHIYDYNLHIGGV